VTVLFTAIGAGLFGALLGAWAAAAWIRHGWAEQVEAARRDATAARRDTELAARRQAALLDALPQALLVFDAAGRVGLANHAGDRYLRPRHGDALIQAAVHDLVAAVQRGDAPGVHRLELAGPPRQVVDLTARRLGQSAGPRAGSGVPGRHGDGGGQVLVVVDDVTERRRLEEMRRDFVANISHELRTPVGALSLLAETITGEDDPDVVARLSGRLHSEATRLARIVDELLLLSHIEDGLGEARPVRIGDLLAGALDRTAGTAAATGIEIDVDVADPDLELPGDRAQLVSALANLLHNALTYSDPGGSVSVSATAVDHWLELAVIDHGIGIPARDIERIFERFYRVDRARSRRTGGTGLGLAIVRHVVTNHGGVMSVASREGEGSTFVLRLPLSPLAGARHDGSPTPAEPSADAPDDDRPLSPAGAADPRPPGSRPPGSRPPGARPVDARPVDARPAVITPTGAGPA
jgi:two-component system sensor histidine kinase SenX3